MKMRLICPVCKQLLVIRKPAIENTRVKCGKCGNKFYAGKAEVMESATAAMPASPPTLAPEPAKTTYGAEHDDVDEDVDEQHDEHRADDHGDDTAESEAPPGVRRKRRVKKKVRDKVETPRSTWWIPAGLAALMVMTFAGIFFGQKPPPVPTPRTPPSHEAYTKVDPNKIEQFGLITNPGALVSQFELPRPVELLGVWDLQEEAGGTMDLGGDGSIRLKAVMVGDKPQDFESRWFVIRHDENTYEIQIGKEAHHVGNHHMNVAMQADGTFRVTKYSHSAGLNVRERVFKKRG